MSAETNAPPSMFTLLERATPRQLLVVALSGMLPHDDASLDMPPDYAIDTLVDDIELILGIGREDGPVEMLDVEVANAMYHVLTRLRIVAHLLRFDRKEASHA